ncbi:hypothetical protein [Amycolatopsis samaneae]|uniref:Transposase n=1 Tax=Amycolatopsis samaneae TaxID=664691 RepID=A0ABW5GED8_9PSEU
MDTERPPTRPLDSFARVIRDLQRVKTQQAKLKARRQDLENLLKAALVATDAQMGAVGTVDGVPSVSFVPQQRTTLDQTTLRKRYPEIAQECSAEQEVWTFRLLNP